MMIERETLGGDWSKPRSRSQVSITQQRTLSALIVDDEALARRGFARTWRRIVGHGHGRGGATGAEAVEAIARINRTSFSSTSRCPA